MKQVIHRNGSKSGPCFPLIRRDGTPLDGWRSCGESLHNATVSGRMSIVDVIVVDELALEYLLTFGHHPEHPWMPAASVN